MPGRLKVRILSGRDLPVMDRASELTDAFVEVRFAGDTFKTEVCKKSLNPQWNSEWFKFEAEDEVLQDEPLDLRILDYDTYSAHDAIGKVYIDLKPLLSRDAPHIISGWFPIFDTMHGIRGELNVQVRVELFTDFNKFRQSSCGIQFFSTCEVPTGWYIQDMLGFVEELVVNDDPEYQWIDKIRTPRASNEARQRLFSKLSGELQRKLGVKVLEMGGDAVLGYHQNFDLEGESGIVVRAIGTAVSLSRVCLDKTPPVLSGHVSPAAVSPAKDSFLEEETTVTATSPPQPPQLGTDSPVIPPGSSPSPSPSQLLQNQRHSTSPVRNIANTSSQRLSESDVGSPPKGGSVASSEGSGGGGQAINLTAQTKSGQYKSSVLQQSIDMVEYPFFTMRTFPVGFIVNLGGVVSSRSVKLLDKIHNPEEPETRDAWWSEIRTEIKCHAAKLGCHAVLGYQEQTTICDDVIVLSAMGTAAKVDLDFNNNPGYTGGSNSSAVTPGTGQVVLSPTSHSPLPGMERVASKDGGATTSGNGGGGGSSGSGASSAGIIEGDKSKDHNKDRHLFVDIGLANQAQTRSLGLLDSTGYEEGHTRCSLCHIPYSVNNLPFEVQLSKCAICRKKYVPEVLFMTIDPPEEMPIWSRGCLIQARLCRAKTKNKSSEQSAREVSDSLPFLEYEVYNQLINKLKIRGLNCLFGMKIQISIGENLLTAVATATGTYLGPMPSPPMPKISSQGATAKESHDMEVLQKKISLAVQKHRDRIMMEVAEPQFDHSPLPPRTLDDDSDEEEEEGDILLEKTRDKNTFVLVVDDAKDESVPLLLQDWIPPEGFEICNTQRPPGIPADKIDRNVQMFTQMVRVHFNPTSNSGLEFANIFETILKRLCFKLRRFKPCSLTDICFNVDLPDEDKVNVAVTGCCLSLHDSVNVTTSISATLGTGSAHNKFTTPSKVEINKRLSGHNQTDDMMFSLDGISDQIPHHPHTVNSSVTPVVTTPSSAPHSASNTPGISRSSSHSRHSKTQRETTKKKEIEIPKGIELTPLTVMYNCHISQYLGYYNFFFIRESTAVRETGGIGGFVQSFLGEILAIVRAHVKALGGNGLVAFHMAHFILDNNPHKNQGQCLINVSGDVVTVTYGDDKGNTVDQNNYFYTEPASISVPSSSST